MKFNLKFIPLLISFLFLFSCKSNYVVCKDPAGGFVSNKTKSISYDDIEKIDFLQFVNKDSCTPEDEADSEKLFYQYFFEYASGKNLVYIIGCREEGVKFYGCNNKYHAIAYINNSRTNLYKNEESANKRVYDKIANLLNDKEKLASLELMEDDIKKGFFCRDL